MTTISVKDVAALLGRDLTTAEEVRCARLIGYAEGGVEDALPGFSVATGTEEVEVVVHGELWTPRFPVTAVNELSVDGTVIPATAFRFTEKGKFQRVYSSAWPVNSSSAGWFCDGALVTIDYDFGLDPPPYTVVNVVAAAVAAVLQRQAVNADGVLSRSETIDGYTYNDQYDRDQARVAVLTVDPSALRRWSRTRQVSVPLVTHG